MDLKRKGKRAGLLSLVFCATVIFLTGCKNDDPVVELPPVAYVSLYQASPNAPHLDVQVDDRLINTYPFDYGVNTGYERFYTGQRNFKFGPSHASNVVIDTTLTFEKDKAYSIFVVDQYEKASVLFLKDNSAAAPAAGKAMVRFLNLSPDTPNVDLVVEGQATPVFDNQPFKAPADFKEVDATTYDFQATGGTDVLQIPNIQLQAGLYYTILVRGYNTPPAGNDNVLSAEVILD